MAPALCARQAPVRPPAYHRTVATPLHPGVACTPPIPLAGCDDGIQGITRLVAAAVTSMNTDIDMLYGVVDPRVKLQ